ncbi:uncharacterized protein METZ01_LOCUS144134 [marine metagenome]|uniref:Uncharacterized protein n=1 Tax=marine metagenome TaxID=408172 RepID=A0A381ZPW2_9ZZZZ
MEGFKKFEKKNIEKILLDNFIDLMPAFYEMESSFLSGIYKRYGDLEGGNIVIFFAKDLHLEILRKREINLNFSLSLDEFWNNHKNIIQKKKKIITIAKSTGLPRETTRRKILSLIKTKHIKKTEKNTVFWEPDSKSKDSYLKIIGEQINSLSKFIFQQSKFFSLNIPVSKIEKEIKNNYSFYWYHYLNTQLQYIKLWQVRFKDLEMLLIGLQTLIQSITCLKNSNRSKSFDSFLLSKMTKSTATFDVKNAGISATSISEVTGIPRANCIRKLEKYIKMKIIEKDPVTKRYNLIPNQMKSAPSHANPILDGIRNTINIFSEFSSILLKSLNKSR